MFYWVGKRYPLPSLQSAQRQLFTGSLYLFAAAIGGFTAFTTTILNVHGSPSSAWIPVAAGAAVLLFVDGLSLCLPSISPPWRIAIATTLPLLASTLFGHWPPVLWFLAVALALLEAGFLILCAHTRIVGAAAFTASILLALAAGTGLTQLASRYLDLYQTPGSLVTLTQVGSALSPSLFALLTFFATLIRSFDLLLPNHR